MQWWELKSTGLSKEARKTILTMRDQSERGFRDITQLRDYLDKGDYQRLVELRTNFLQDHNETHKAQPEAEPSGGAPIPFRAPPALRPADPEYGA